MQWLKKQITLPVAITLGTLFLGAVGTFFVLVAHAEDVTKHVTPMQLQQTYVPRSELDVREKALDEKLNMIHQDVKTKQQILLDHLVD